VRDLSADDLREHRAAFSTDERIEALRALSPDPAAAHFSGWAKPNRVF
jgi:hypothetical protein